MLETVGRRRAGPGAAAAGANSSRRSARSRSSSAAIERLLTRTDADAATFAAELGKLLAWAGKGGRIRAADVEANVEDESSEDMYGFFDAIGRRDAGDALQRLERLFDGRDVRQGDRAFEKIEDIWPIQLFGMIAGEVRRMLLLRARLDEAGPAASTRPCRTPPFQARVLPRLLAPAAPSAVRPSTAARGRRIPSRSTRRPSARPSSARGSSRARSRGRPTWTWR